MPTLNWDDLRLFLTVARSGRLIAAGRALGIDHTTVARRVVALETALGTRLLDRTPRGTSLTASGTALLDHAERIEAEILAASGEIGEGDARVSGAVRLATPEAFGTYLVAPNVRHLHERHPDLSLELMPESQLVRLANREADIAVMLNRPPRGPIVARKLADYGIGLYASRSYLDGTGPIEDAAELVRHPFASYIEDRLDLPELRFLNEVSADARPVFRSTSITAQQAAVAGGLGLGLLHIFAACQDERLVRLLPRQVEVRRTYWLAFHESQQRLPRIRAVIDFLNERAGAMLAST